MGVVFGTYLKRLSGLSAVEGGSVLEHGRFFKDFLSFIFSYACACVCVSEASDIPELEF